MAQKVGFSVIGTQKGGTATIDALLREHPQIQMPHLKETHFFDDEKRNWSQPEYDDLHSYYDGAEDRLWGEGTPVTMYWRPAVRRLCAYNPDIKLVLLLRNPVERAYSHWRMEYRARRETALFGYAIREGRTRLTLTAEIEGLHRDVSYVERGFYWQQIGYLLQHFPREQIHCEISERLFVDQRSTLDRLSRFLDIAKFAPTVPIIHKNQAEEIEYPSILSRDDRGYLASVYRSDIASLEDFLGERIEEWVTS